jgi:hypothetical protein
MPRWFSVDGEMAMAFTKSETASENHGLDAARLREHGSHGGRFATVLSAIALVFSGFSYYDTNMKTAELTVYVPPMIHYGRDGEADVFNIPITISNEGARTGTVLTMELDVENLNPKAEKRSARFHSAFIGEYPRGDAPAGRSFAPLSIPGHGTFTETVRFYPMAIGLPYVVDDKGDYRLTLRLLTATPRDPDLIEKHWLREPKPLTFDVTLPGLAPQYLSEQHETQAMFSKTWQPAISTPSDDIPGQAPRNSPLQPSKAP